MLRVDAAYAGVLAIGIGLRVLVSWVSAWGESLVDVLELATPLDRLDLLRELHVLLRSVHVAPRDVWASLSVHHSPLLLLVPHSWIMDARVSAALWIAMDVISAWALANTAALLRQRTKLRILSPALVAACFLLNPYAIFACAAKSMSQLRAALTVLSVWGAVQGQLWTLVCAHAVNCLLFLTPLMLTPCFALLGSDAHAAHGAWRAKFGVRRADAWTAFLKKFASRTAGVGLAGLVWSYFLSGDPYATFVRSVYGSRLGGDDLTPTVGLFWYFFVEMFAHFYAFFLMVVQVHMWLYTVPVTLKYRSDPLFALTLLLGIQALFETYPCVGDTALFLGVWSLTYGRLADYLRYPMVSFMLFAYTTLLFPVFRYLWMYAGAANANFYFAVSLVHALALGSVILDAVWAWGRERWEAERVALQADAPRGKTRLIVQH